MPQIVNLGIKKFQDNVCFWQCFQKPKNFRAEKICDTKEVTEELHLILVYVKLYLINWGVMLLASVDISTCAPWIMQNEQHFVAGEIPHKLDAQMEGH
jgi:hypothetical protein